MAQIASRRGMTYVKLERLHTIAGEATTTRMGLQETNVSVYNTVPRTSYGSGLLKTHVRIAGDRSAYRLSPAVRSLLKQKLHKL